MRRSRHAIPESGAHQTLGETIPDYTQDFPPFLVETEEALTLFEAGRSWERAYRS